jgi:hypothetical protein
MDRGNICNYCQKLGDVTDRCCAWRSYYKQTGLTNWKSREFREHIETQLCRMLREIRRREEEAF